MDSGRGDDQKKMGMGRGNIILKMMKMKEEEEALAAQRSAQPSPDMASSSVSRPPSNISALPGPSAGPPVSLGRGRANLLELLKAKSKETPGPVQPAVPSAVPSAVPPVSMGRAALLNLIKSTSSVGQTSVQPSVSKPAKDDAGVLGQLSELSVYDTRSTSELSFKPPQGAARRGTSGKQIQMSANYISLKIDPGKGLFNYEVKFNPDIDSRPLRRKLLNQHLTVLGKTKVFDGVTLYLPQQLQNNITTLESTHPMDGSLVTLKVIYKKQQDMSENIPFFNVLLGRVMRSLSLVRIGQHNFNPKGVHAVPQHRLEVWPGYVTAINEYEDGLKLCIDAKHRVMRTETVREMMINLQSNKTNFKDAVMKELIGLSVFTRYNNKTYRVDDIAWDKNPSYEFEKGDNKITLIEYYKSHWNLQIRDLNQPLLVNCAKKKLTDGSTQESLILLVPELCYVASLTDSIRSDFRIMKDLDAVTKITPNSRRDVLKHFIREVQNNDVPREILADWGLRMEGDLSQFPGRVLEPEVIYFGNNITFKPSAQRPAEWSSAACKNPMLRSPNLSNWCVLYSQRDTRCTKEFVDMLRKISTCMGMNVNEPRTICLRDDRIESYVRELRQNIQQNVNLMVMIFPTNRTDRYAAVKRVCCVEMPIPSQVIISRTISRGDKLKSVTEKIALQINCKLGGALWALAIPMENCMICGIDVYHGGVGQSTKGSVAGFVASLDKLLTTWHSKVCFQGRHQELVDLLQICFIAALKAYYKHNKRYPDRIIVYRDGVGDGQFETVSKYEVKQIRETFKHVEPNYQPKLSVIIVQKRINTRLFAKCQSGLENPPPGTIVDSHITKNDVYDFYLVSQNIRQGTVSPTRYIVVYDNTNMKPEHVQRLTYKLCHLYYNWPGTIKAPAPCQYAHKLVSLIGQNVQLEPHHSLSDTLFYL